LFVKGLIGFFGEVAEIVAQQQVIVEFAGGAEGDLDEASKVRITPPSTPFGEIGRN
jgi:hypothetical protein